MKEGFAMESGILTLGAIILALIAGRAISLSMRDPSKETDGEKRRREKREKREKEASKPK
jgi:hypothetical protein